MKRDRAVLPDQGGGMTAPLFHVGQRLVRKDSNAEVFEIIAITVVFGMTLTTSYVLRPVAFPDYTYVCDIDFAHEILEPQRAETFSLPPNEQRLERSRKGDHREPSSYPSYVQEYIDETGGYGGYGSYGFTNTNGGSVIVLADHAKKCMYAMAKRADGASMRFDRVTTYKAMIEAATEWAQGVNQVGAL